MRKEYKWSEFKKTYAPMDKHTYTSSTQALLTECNKWEVYIFTSFNYKIISQKVRWYNSNNELCEDIMLLDGVILNNTIGTMWGYSFNKQKGLELYSTRYKVKESNFPQYIIAKIKNLINEMELN